MKLILLAATPYRSIHPVGQVYLDLPGNESWICPEGVTTVSLAMVGAGKHHGGNLRYINDIPVVPGTTYIIFIPKDSPNPQETKHVYAFGYSTESPLSDTIKGHDGTPEPDTTQDGTIYGGNAGGLPYGYEGLGIDLRTFELGDPPNGLTGGNAGGGGGYQDRVSFRGGHGAARVIWGDNRAFPDKHIRDMS